MRGARESGGREEGERREAGQGVGPHRWGDGARAAGLRAWVTGRSTQQHGKQGVRVPAHLCRRHLRHNAVAGLVPNEDATHVTAQHVADAHAGRQVAAPARRVVSLRVSC